MKLNDKQRQIVIDASAWLRGELANGLNDLRASSLEADEPARTWSGIAAGLDALVDKDMSADEWRNWREVRRLLGCTWDAAVPKALSIRICGITITRRYNGVEVVGPSSMGMGNK